MLLVRISRVERELDIVDPGQSHSCGRQACILMLAIYGSETDVLGKSKRLVWLEYCESGGEW